VLIWSGMQIIDGRKIRDQILVDLKSRIASLSFKPVFCDVLVGDNSASTQYVKMKEKTAEALGIKTYPAVFSESITTEDLITEIQKIAQVSNMSGLIIQLPLPSHIDTKRVLNSVPQEIDVDSISITSSEKFYSNEPVFVFPTAAAVMEIIDSLNININDKKIVMVGKGMLVGLPVAHLLKNKGASVFSIDSSTENLRDVLHDADLVISATGQAGLIKGEMLKQGVVIIDAGTSESNGGISGDVDRPSVENIASALSPVPGGVGPVTVAMLMQNVVISAERKIKI
jgi:methylenetetrahydrofolate dehydrogenase (NADP+)/methenyltetrahydrofolate cyclohydrolase